MKASNSVVKAIGPPVVESQTNPPIAEASNHLVAKASSRGQYPPVEEASDHVAEASNLWL